VFTAQIARKKLGCQPVFYHVMPCAPELKAFMSKKTFTLENLEAG
jgi:hypothetical protein